MTGRHLSADRGHDADPGRPVREHPWYSPMARSAPWWRRRVRSTLGEAVAAVSIDVFQIQTDITMPAAARHVAQFFPRRALSDPSYVVKTILTEAFGGPLLRPGRCAL